MKCRRIGEAKPGAIPGTRQGPALLGIAAAHIAEAPAGADVADLAEQPRGPGIPPSAAPKAREAAARVPAAACGRILEYVAARAAFVRSDGAPARIAGARGCVRLACRGDAARMARVAGRSAAVPDVRFPGPEDKPAAADQCSGCNKIKERQACLVHVLRHSGSGAVRPEGGDEEEKRPHDRLRGTHGTVEPAGAADEDTIKGPESRVLGMAGECGQGRGMRAAPSSARPNMLASPGHPACRAGTTGPSRLHARGRPGKRGSGAGRGARPACAASP